MEPRPHIASGTLLQDGDKRWSAILALDVVGFSGLTQTLGQEKVYDLLQRVLRLVGAIVEEHGGYVVDTAGDGILAAFGAPVAIEDASLQTCRAAQAVTGALTRDAPAFQSDFGHVPQVRIGIAGGNVMVVREAGGGIKLVGDAVNLAARLEALAGPEEVILTDVIRQDAVGSILAEDARDVQVKGFAQPLRVHRLAGLRAAPTRFLGASRRGLSAFVSRDAEVAQALDVLQNGGRSLAISGVAGIGKSRLLHEVLLRLGPEARAVIAQCAPGDAGRSLTAARSLVKRLSGLPETATLADHLHHLREVAPGSCTADGIARFTSPLAAEKDPVGRVLHDRAFLTTLFRSVTRLSPTRLVLEDVHWIDRATGDLLADLIAADVPLVLTTREVAGVPYADEVTHLGLLPLGQDDIARILTGQIDRPLAPALVTRVIDRAEGNPLVAEEMASTIRASASLIETPEGLDVDAPTQEILSGNLQQLVLSRVDRLSVAQRKTLQVAAAIGRDFGWALVQAASDPAEFAADVAGYEGIIEGLDAQTARFSHALVREAVYDGLLSVQRRDIHRRVAVALEQLGRDNGFATRAHHYVAAEMAPEAARALLRAGDEALQAYDLFEADRRFTDAFAYTVADPSVLDDVSYAELCHLWMRTLSVNGNYGKALKASEQFLPRLTGGAYLPGSAVARAIVALALTGARDYAAARDLLLTTIAEAEAHDDAHGAAWAKSTLARVYDESDLGGHRQVQALCEEIIPIAQSTDDRLLEMTAHYLLVANYRTCGRRLKALETADAIEAIADRYQDRRARAYANWARAVMHSAAGDPEAAAGLLAIAQEDVLPHTTDNRVLQTVDIFIRLHTDPLDTVRPRIAKLRARMVDLLDYNLIHIAV